MVVVVVVAVVKEREGSRLPAMISICCKYICLSGWNVTAFRACVTEIEILNGYELYAHTGMHVLIRDMR
ncbi:hypothetical protein L195_g042064 [Trifolium pratense]|uniref:Uncharacterized protein n=1 Tax=Trifolium pratense TaxID=57577 RepID=A0A2K3M5E1_TRIPR|nr:hypothetical protein L195_g042064 [Trifolium pratense]